MSIEIRGISKSFNSFQALRAIDLTIPDGELVALLGPSGCGKTTLLRILAGLEIPDPAPGAGIFFHGRDVARVGAGGRKVGFVFQHYALFRHMTVFENIAFGLRVRPRDSRPSRSEIASRVLELLRLIQLEGMQHRYPSQLSGGQRQRVALARALAAEPGVLLLDEPFGSLDARVRQDLRRWLRRLHDDLRVTSIFVTHDQEEALEVADSVVVMNAGRIEQIGAPAEVYHNPINAFVMTFLGRVNIFRGRAGAAPTLVAGDGGDARVMVRPHDFDLSHEPLGPNSFAGRVIYLNTAGSSVRLEVKSDMGTEVWVETSPECRQQLGLAVGSRVFLTPRQMSVFQGDGRRPDA